MIVKRVSYFSFIIAITTIATVSSCNRVKESAKQTINKAGAIVGTGSSEFLDGVSEGVTQSFDCSVELVKVLEEKGLKIGKFKIATNSSGQENIVSIYLIFDKDYKGQVSAKIFDNKGYEYGRASLALEAKAAQAGYFDFVFDKRTNIERKSRILLE
jgi:hypothetical protein